MKQLKYFQDLPDEVKEIVFENVKQHLIQEREITSKTLLPKDIEIIDDWINRNNTPYFGQIG